MILLKTWEKEIINLIYKILYFDILRKWRYTNDPVSMDHGLRPIQNDYMFFPNGVTSMFTKSLEYHRGFH